MAFSRFLGTRRSCSCLNGSLASLRAFCIQGKSYGSSAPAVEEKIAWTPRSRRTGAIGVKLGMTKMWTKKGDSFPVTLIRIQDCQVVQTKTQEKDGFSALQLGAVDQPKLKNVTKPLRKHFEKAGVNPKKKIWEFPVTEDALLPPGTTILARHFLPGQYVDVTGITIGKGFQGVMKRHGMKGQPASHGVTKTHRKMGATGGGGDPGRIWPGKRMPGRMGNKRRVTMNLKVCRINNKYNVLYVKGGVSGSANGYVRVTDARRKPVKEAPPFPTFRPEDVVDAPIAEEEFAEDVQRPDDDTIAFEVKPKKSKR
ncbi:large ribosomal subunit protein uL3-like [Oscarella lobularis]|uniref:large ribosomal subunit protein uL3-like n=1 Tax=Oscarella lobularis TaxID=121494 RepID=UPI003313145B